MTNSSIYKLIIFDILIFCAASVFLTLSVKSSPLDSAASMPSKANASRILWEIFKRKNEINNNEDNNKNFPLDTYENNIQNERKSGKKDRKKNKKNKHRKQTFRSIDNFPEMDEKPFDPSQKKSNREMLFMLTLRNYNSDFMRIKRPKESIDYPFGKLYIPKNSRVMKSLVKHMMRRYKHLPYSNSYKMDLFKKRVKRKIRKFLSTYTVCPVWYRWAYKGPQFWPPWIKEGQCDNSGGSCSMPPGMSCQENQHERIGVLRYFCMKGWDRSRCGWRKVFIQVLVTCKCSCPNQMKQ